MATDTGVKRIPCPLHGCRRVYSNNSALDLHIKEHEVPAQSLAGKVLLCSNTGCNGSFPNMQKLMEHTRHHHKPNIYFMCESCRTKLRSYRGLLTHLHTCSKVPRAKAKPGETNQSQSTGTAAATAAATVTNTNITAPPVDQRNQLQDPTSTPQQPQASKPPHLQGNLPSAPRSFSSSGSILRPSVLSFPEKLASPQLSAPPVQPSPMASDGHSIEAPEPSEVRNQDQAQTRPPEMTVQPAPVSAPQAPSGPTAIWKKNQATTCNSRILWEHTRGQYTCVQCGKTATNRKEMNEHISSFHSGNKAAEDFRKPGTDADNKQVTGTEQRD